MQRRILIVVLGLSLAGQNSLADDDPWTAKASLGYLASTGNSETTNFSGTFDLGYDHGRWHHALGLLAVGANSDFQPTATDPGGVRTTAERYGLAAKTKYDMREFDYIFGLLKYEKDKFSGYDRQTSETFGYGRRFLHSDTHILNGDVGLGLRQQRLRDGSSDNGAILRLGADYRYNISATSAFTQQLAIEAGADNTSIEGVSELKAKLRDALSLVLNLTIKTNTEVPAGTEKTDTFTSINLEYDFR